VALRSSATARSPQFLVVQKVSGVIFISGGVQFGAISVNITSDFTKSNAFEIVAVPAGSSVNTNVRMNSQVAYAPNSYRALIDTWSFTTFDCDPIAGNVTISFFDDEGRSLKTFHASMPLADLGSPFKP